MRESIHDIRCDFLCLQDNQSERTRLCRAFRIIYACAQLIYRSFQGSFKRNINVIQDIDVPLSQHSLSRAIDEAFFADLLATAANPRSNALALSTSIRHAGDWLNVVPSSALDLHLLDREYLVCLQYWLGLQMFEENPRCPVCLSTSDHFGDHHVGCGGNMDRIFRHNSLRDAVFSAAQTATLAPRKKVLSLIPGSQNRPADVFLPCWKGGRPAALDITVIPQCNS